jgi:hypothetical protein
MASTPVVDERFVGRKSKEKSDERGRDFYGRPLHDGYMANNNNNNNNSNDIIIIIIIIIPVILTVTV